MRSRKLWIGILLLSGIVMGAADASQDPVATPVAVQQEPSGEPREALTPMMQEIFDYWELQQAQIAELEAQFEAAEDEATALSIRREIESTLNTTELEILRIQLRYALAEGRTETAVKLQEAIEEILSPPELPPAEERPEPTEETR